jgi:GNAT superfamily N-acetyltransferase
MLRAFFVHPEFIRRGIGRTFVEMSERAARMDGFTRMDIVATLPGKPLYEACGYRILEAFSIQLANGAAMPALRLTKEIAPIKR